MKGKTLAMTKDWKDLKKGQAVKVLVSESDHIYVYPLGAKTQKRQPIGAWVEKGWVE